MADPKRLPADLEIDAFLAQGELLARLIADPSWEAWEGLIRAMRTGALEQLAIATDPQEVARYQGAAIVLAEVLKRPREIAAAAAAQQRAEEEEKVGLRPELRAILGHGIDRDEDSF